MDPETALDTNAIIPAQGFEKYQQVGVGKATIRQKNRKATVNNSAACSHKP
jgi:hypothetical protein